MATDFLFFIGGCCYLDGLEQRRSFDTCWGLFVASSSDCKGSCTFPDEAPQGSFSGLLVSLSYLTYSYVLAMSNCVDEVRGTPLSYRATRCWSTQWGLACREAREPQEKNCLSLAYLVFSW
jgi:hypothetical protein